MEGGPQGWPAVSVVMTTIAKKDSRFHAIFKLCSLNRYSKVLQFHMLTTTEVMSVIQPGDWFILQDQILLAMW